MRLAGELASFILAAAPIGAAPVASAGCDPQMAPIAGNISAITGAINPCVGATPAGSPPAAPSPARQLPRHPTEWTMAFGRTIER
jgi:hypothetical protein